MDSMQRKERAGKILFLIGAIVCIVAVLAIFCFIVIKSLPALGKIGFFKFVFGKTWSPDRLDTYDTQRLSGTYGIFTMIVGTLAAGAGALLVGGTLGYFTAVFLAFFCPKKLKSTLSAMIDLLAGIPSVVYGFFGIVFLLPKLSLFTPKNGSGLLATSLLLGLMILPTVVSLSKTSFEEVPKSYYEGAIALGATHTEAVFRTVVPAGRSGVITSLVLAIGRAIGETMAVVMVAGNAPTYPSGLFGSFRVLTANIVMEMGYAGEVQEGALVATGAVLLLFVFLINLFFSLFSHRAVKRAVARSQTENTKRKKDTPFRRFTQKCKRVQMRIREWFGTTMYRLKGVCIGKYLAIVSSVVTGFALLLLIIFIYANGLPYLIKNPRILYGKFVFASENITVLSAIVTTLMTIALSLLLALPIGMLTAVFLNEYAKKTNLFTRLLRGAIDVLSGVPSIVYGLFGMITFVKIFGGRSSILSGSLTVSIMLLPTIVRSVEESLKNVPDAIRAGSFALGAGKTRTIFKIVLPSAVSGIVSATILSVGRVISESAPFLYTMGSVLNALPKGYMDSGASLAVALYQLSGEGWHMQEAYATAVILMSLVFIVNFVAKKIARGFSRKRKGE